MVLIESRNNAKNTRDFDEADRVRDQLRSYGVNLDDKSRTWSTSDGRTGKMESGGGFARGDKQNTDGSMSWENTIYIQGLPTNAREHDVADFFGTIGPIKKSKKSHNMGEPTVHIYKDKRTGAPKGDATVSYEDAETAQSAIKWFDGVEFQNRKNVPKMKISIATRPSGDRFAGGRRY